MLEASPVHERIRALEERVVAKWRFAENRDLGGNELLQPPECPIRAGGCEAGRGIPGETYPTIRYPGRVDGESPDVEGHVGEVVIVFGDEVDGSRGWIHPGRHAPCRLGPHGYARRTIKAEPSGIHEDIRAVEESEIGRC